MIKIASILDNFSRECFGCETELHHLTPRNWRLKLLMNRYDLLLVESAWQGKDSEWQNKVRIRGKKFRDTLIVRLVNAFKAKKIPTIFWNKEDPVHFNVFINTAKLFDFVFTTDANCVECYEECGIKAQVMPFAASTKLHYFSDDSRIEDVFFAGSYYAHFPERCVVTDWILSAAFDFGLHIYDRNINSVLKKLLSAEEFKRHVFPEKFRPYIKGCIPAENMGDIFRKYKVMLNINTVSDSPTMCARRVFEALHAGCAVISSPSPTNSLLFKDSIIQVNNYDEARKALMLLLNDETYRKALVNKGREIIASKHTYTERIKMFTSCIAKFNK